MKEPLVSLITPCYNGEKYIGRFFDTVLMQDYPRLELIFINDGSMDATSDVVQIYRQRLEDKLERFIYYVQPNMGQAAALNRGLSIFTGEYLMWPDSDDFFPCPYAVSRRVQWMEIHKDVGLLCSRAKMVSEDNLSQTLKELFCKTEYDSQKLFENFALCKHVQFAPGLFIMRAGAFKKAYPQRQIPVYSCGQNWQMLLPVVLNEKVGFINDILYSYVLRKNSHSHNGDIAYEKVCEKDAARDQAIREMVALYLPAGDFQNDVLRKLAFRQEMQKIERACEYGIKYQMKTAEVTPIRKVVLLCYKCYRYARTGLKNFLRGMIGRTC